MAIFMTHRTEPPEELWELTPIPLILAFLVTYNLIEETQDKKYQHTLDFLNTVIDTVQANCYDERIQDITRALVLASTGITGFEKDDAGNNIIITENDKINPALQQAIQTADWRQAMNAYVREHFGEPSPYEEKSSSISHR